MNARRTQRGRMTTTRGRRGFTLLEMVLAVMVGSMVVVLSIGLLTSIERGNGMMSARTEQTSEMQTTRMVMNRAFNSILASQPPQNQGRAPAVATATAEGAEPVAAAPTRSQAPRVMLDQDARVGGVMERREPDGTIVQQVPQRLEIVLLDSPVPSASNVDPFALARVAKREASRKKARELGTDRANGGEGADGVLGVIDDIASPTTEDPATDTEGNATEDGEAGEDGEGQAVEDGDLGVRAVRGVFELVPQSLTVAQRGQLRESVRTKPIYELWWRPLASPQTVDEWLAMSRGEQMLETARLGKPYKLASNLTFARWRMFDDREKRTRYEATVYNQLPAYAEFEVETTAGLRHQWLFEIGWAIGPETSAEREASRGPGTNTQRNTVGAGGDTPTAGGSGRVQPGNGVDASGAESKSGGGK